MENLDCALERFFVVDGVGPQRIEVRSGELYQFQTYQGNVIDEGEVSRDECRELRQSVNGLAVDDNSNLNADAQLLEVKDAADGLVVRPARLHYEVMLLGNVRIERDGHQEILMVQGRELSRELRIGECATVA